MLQPASFFSFPAFTTKLTATATPPPLIVSILFHPLISLCSLVISDYPGTPPCGPTILGANIIGIAMTIAACQFYFHAELLATLLFCRKQKKNENTVYDDLSVSSVSLYSDIHPVVVIVTKRSREGTPPRKWLKIGGCRSPIRHPPPEWAGRQCCSGEATREAAPRAAEAPGIDPAASVHRVIDAAIPSRRVTVSAGAYNPSVRAHARRVERADRERSVQGGSLAPGGCSHQDESR